MAVRIDAEGNRSTDPIPLNLDQAHVEDLVTADWEVRRAIQQAPEELPDALKRQGRALAAIRRR
jgi:hypothetical protein